MDEEEFERVVAAARERVDPDPEERAALSRAGGHVLERTREAVAGLDVTADVVQVGSTARGTWVSGDHDLDVFVRFPTELPREDLERLGLQVGRAVLPDGREEYAEHPYVTGTVEGFDVDLVPCYDVDDATEIRSAVDRTPFHNRYLEERLDDDLAAEIRLAKGLLKGVGVYGSDLRTRGFSGYLTELLVVEYGGFREFLAAVSEWHPPVRLDPEDHATREFDDALVVVDPTDSGRNVAAVVSETNVARTIHHARELLAGPDLAAFVPGEPPALSPAEVREHVERRGTVPAAVRFTAPALVDDQLYPQLERSLSGVCDALDRRGFGPIRATAMAGPLAGEGNDNTTSGDGNGDRPAALFVECTTATLPRIERHEGPPVHVGEHARAFYGKYATRDGSGDECRYGPFLEGGRYVVERERDHRTVRGVLEERLFEVGLGARVESALREGYDVLVGADCAGLAGHEAFGRALGRFYDPRP
jgi:tRNA nucleotidyltransferase (CCA-adding enzyme)